MMELPTPNHELDAAAWDEITAEEPAGDAFEQGNPPSANDGTPTAVDEPPADSAPPATAPAAAAPAPSEPIDPFAGLPDAVRNALATIPTLQQELRSTVGRVGALQRELAQARQPAPEPEAPRQPTKLEALRAELPEVADAIDELSRSNNQGQSLAELRAELVSELQEELLDTNRATWAQEVTSNEFQTWLTTQPPEYQQTVRSSSRASVLLGALGKFDQFRVQADKRTEQLQRNQSRLSAAVAPSGQTRRTAAKSEDDMSPDELWNEITR